MQDLPREINIQIVRRVGLSGFRQLGPLILAGRETREAVFSPQVLTDVRLNEYMVQGSMANEDSVYRPFLLKCLSHGNLGAKYIEAIRMLSNEGPSQQAFAYLEQAEHKLVFAVFAHGVFLLLAGRYEEGIAKIERIWETFDNVEQAVHIAQVVVCHIASKGTPRLRLYRHSHRFPELPWCVFITCTPTDVCKNCYAFWFSAIVSSLC